MSKIILVTRQKTHINIEDYKTFYFTDTYPIRAGSGTRYDTDAIHRNQTAVVISKD